MEHLSAHCFGFTACNFAICVQSRCSYQHHFQMQLAAFQHNRELHHQMRLASKELLKSQIFSPGVL